MIIPCEYHLGPKQERLEDKEAIGLASFVDAFNLASYISDYVTDESYRSGESVRKLSPRDLTRYVREDLLVAHDTAVENGDEQEVYRLYLSILNANAAVLLYDRLHS